MDIPTRVQTLTTTFDSTHLKYYSPLALQASRGLDVLVLGLLDVLSVAPSLEHLQDISHIWSTLWLYLYPQA